MFKNSRINRFKFDRIAPFIGSDTLQPLKMNLSSDKGYDKCGNSSLCQLFVCEHAERFVHIYIYIYIYMYIYIYIYIFAV